jgi:zinc-ribbon domain
MFCTQCGTELKDNQKFCTACGKKTKAGTAPTPTGQEAVPLPPQDTVPGSQPKPPAGLTSGVVQQAPQQPSPTTDLRPPIEPPPPPAGTAVPIPGQDRPSVPGLPGPQQTRSVLPWVLAAVAVIAIAAGGYFGFRLLHRSAPQQAATPAHGPVVQSGVTNTKQAQPETSPNANVPTTPPPQNNVATSLPPVASGRKRPAVAGRSSRSRTVAEAQSSSSSQEKEPSWGFGPGPKPTAATSSGGPSQVVRPEPAPPPQTPVQPAPPVTPVLPPAASLRTSSASITEGQSVTLIWAAENATEVNIQPGVGSVAATGSVKVAPRTPTTYILTAMGSGRSAIARATVNVLPAGPSEGTVVWEGNVHGTSPVSIEGNHASVGTIVSGGLPGLPCTVQLERTKRATLQTSPAQWNGWKLIVLQVRGNGRVTVRISWSLLR